METIRENILRELVANRSTLSVSAVGCHGGFSVAVQSGPARRTLGSTRGNVRVFSNLTGLATLLRDIGISQFAVDSAHYQPGRIRSARPDRAKALKMTRTTPRQSELLN
jgi:hypothetical protein